jgi:hypothetical protein
MILIFCKVRFCTDPQASVLSAEAVALGPVFVASVVSAEVVALGPVLVAADAEV